ncbi:MAG: flippase [Bacteroidia bacterium]|nr:flippase [Bacteroidia bacterium]
MEKILTKFRWLLKEPDSRELVLKSGTAFFIRLFGFLASYLFTVTVTRLAGADAWGVFSVCFTFMNIAAVVSNLGLETAIVRYVAAFLADEAKTKLLKVYKIGKNYVVVCGLIVTVISYLLIPFIATHLGKPVLIKPLQISALLVLPLALLNYQAAAFQGTKDIMRYTVFQNVLRFIFAAIAFGVLWLNGVFDPILAFGAGIVLSWLLASFLWQQKYRGIAIDNSNESASGLLKTALPLLLASSIRLLTGWTDTMFLAYFHQNSDVGIYNVVLKLSQLTIFTLVAFNSVTAPKFSEAYAQGDMVSLGKIMRRSNVMIFWTTIPILLITSLLPSFWLGLFGKEFIAGKIALWVLAFAQFINAATGSCGVFLQMTGSEKVFQWIAVIAAVLDIIVNIILTPTYGILGSACASGLSIIFWNLASVWYIRKKFAIKAMYIPGIY